jgi:hypothetical protein
MKEEVKELLTTELLTKFAGYLTERVTDTNRVIIADFMEKFLVVEIKKMEGPAQPEMIDIPMPKVKAEDIMGMIKQRSGNGHKILKKRPLTDSEKDNIRVFFKESNGQIESDACVEYKKLAEVDPDVAIFQITGFVSYLHNRVASGELTLSNMPAYFEFIKGHRNLWATYNSPRYQALRARLEICPTEGVTV